MNNQDLVLRIKNRDNKACSVLYEIIEKKVKYFCCYYKLEQNIIPDLIQESILRCLISIDKFRKDCPLENWVFLIVVSVCKNYVTQKNHKNKYAVEISLSDFIDKQAELIDNQAVSPLEMLIENEKQMQLSKAIQSLPYNLRKVYVLSTLENYSYNEISVKIGKSVNAVKKRMQRAKYYIKKYLEKIY